jgi:hypothetical protein
MVARISRSLDARWLDLCSAIAFSLAIERQSRLFKRPASHQKIDFEEVAMSASAPLQPTPSTTPAPLSSVLRAVVSHRGVQVTVVSWVIGYVVVLWLAQGSLPFDRPAVAHMPFASQMAQPIVGMLEIFGLMVLVFFLTRKRVIPDMAARAPERRVALRETVLVLRRPTRLSTDGRAHRLGSSFFAPGVPRGKAGQSYAGPPSVRRTREGTPANGRHESG